MCRPDPLAFMNLRRDFDERLRESTEGELTKGGGANRLFAGTGVDALRFGGGLSRGSGGGAELGSGFNCRGRPAKMSTYLLGSNARPSCVTYCSVLVARTERGSDRRLRRSPGFGAISSKANLAARVKPWRVRITDVEQKFDLMGRPGRTRVPAGPVETAHRPC